MYLRGSPDPVGPPSTSSAPAGLKLFLMPVTLNYTYSIQPPASSCQCPPSSPLLGAPARLALALPTGGGVHNSERGWTCAGCVRQHVCAQQLQAWPQGTPPGPLRRSGAPSPHPPAWPDTREHLLQGLPVPPTATGHLPGALAAWTTAQASAPGHGQALGPLT